MAKVISQINLFERSFRKVELKLSESANFAVVATMKVPEIYTALIFLFPCKIAKVVYAESPSR